MTQILNYTSIAKEARLNIVRVAESAGSVHFGGCFSLIEILAAYYAPLIEKKQTFEEFCAENLLILSKGHCGLAVYSILTALGIITEEELATYCKDGSSFIGHVKKSEKLGIGWSTGSLGHGLSVSMGIARAHRELSLHRHVLCILGDGEMHEGSNWEALLHLSHDSNLPLTIVLDNNKYLSLGRTEDIRPIEPIHKKIEHFHVQCISVDGHDSATVADALKLGKSSRRVLFVNANTLKGYGVSFTQGVSDWHAKRATPEELALMKAELILKK